MNKIVSHGIAGLIGGAICATVTYFITNKITRDKYDRLYHEAMDKAYEDTKKSKCTDCVTEAPAEYFEEPVAPKEPELKIDIEKAKETYNSARAEFNERLKIIQNKYKGKTSEKTEERNNDMNPVIENISEDAYCDPTDSNYRDDYDHVDITWYEGDDVMMFTDTQVVINNIEDYIGYGHLKFVDNACFIRNKKKEADYMITWDVGYYQEEILGIDPAFRDEDTE